MTTLETVEVRLGASCWMLSARRLWEFGEYGQPMNLQVSPSIDPSQAIDIIDCSGDSYLLTGLTLADAEKDQLPQALDRSLLVASAVQSLRNSVSSYLGRLRLARGHRKSVEEFAGTAPTGPLRLKGLSSRLQARLAAENGALPPSQWLATVANYTRSGITEEEIRLSGVREFLAGCEPSARVTGGRLAQACTFPDLQLSILSMVGPATRQLRLVPAPPQKYRSVPGEHRRRQPGARTTLWIDPSLGYRLDRVEHEALWGHDVSWQAVDEQGRPVSGRGGMDERTGKQDAERAAASDAARRYPKHVASPRWQRWAWGGGESYREWLVTAPGLQVGFFSSHFGLRNVLIHLRVDLRQSAAGEPVLFVQEVQSDWAQGSRSTHPMGTAVGVREMPFAREWTLLAAKLLILHAASLGVHAIAWTTGDQQARRWYGLGEPHLRRLYDQVLPREFERLLGSAPASRALFVPIDFTTRLAEAGYEVVAANGQVLGCAATLEDAWRFVPDGGREDLLEVHSIALPESVRKAILATGFPAWGYPLRDPGATQKTWIGQALRQP